MNTTLAIFTISFLLTGAGHFAFAQYDDKLAILETNQGQIAMEFFPDDAPNHVANFTELAESGFYDGTLFHRIISGFMIQGGDPNTIDGDPSTWGTGGPETTVAAEFNTIKHNRGIVSMARSADPNSAGSQFFIVHQNSNFLDQQYTVFGRIVTEESFETLDKIASVETKTGGAPVNPEQVRILRASIIERSDMPSLMSLDQPERTAPVPDTSQNQLYENPELGITFSAPPGWLLQQPEKTGEDAPDVVAVGPRTGLVNPVITLTVRDTSGMTFDDIVQEKKQTLDEMTSTAGLEIISLEESTIKGKEAFTILAERSFQSNNQFLLVKFKEVLIHDDEKSYTLSYANDQDNFEAQLPSFDDSIAAFEILGADDESADEDAGGGGGCLIATAAFDSELAPQVQLLREIRDNKVMNTDSGAAFMTGFNQLYYSFSPAIADLQRQNPLFKDAVKLAITPMLSSLSLLNYVEIDSEHDILGYGLAIIMLNIGMYLVAPALVICRIRR